LPVWGAIASADVRTLQSPFRSGIEIEDYQLDPLVRAVQTPRINLLIADDVGLGKTIEAGLVIQELIVRSRARIWHKRRAPQNSRCCYGPGWPHDRRAECHVGHARIQRSDWPVR